MGRLWSFWGWPATGMPYSGSRDPPNPSVPMMWPVAGPPNASDGCIRAA
jgi:hypothetical protein